MFSKAKSAMLARPSKSGAPGLSFIGAEAIISGDVGTAAQLHIDGRIDGHVRCAALCQGESGVVAGNINAEDARIAGLVEGDVFATNLILEPTARIKGDITYQTISIAAGAQVDGRLARREALGRKLEETNEILTATPIVEAIAESRRPRKGAAKASDESEPGLADDIFTLTPPPRQAAAG
jgi:cytoskeletal protein CcmA (bactofilin family)